MIVTVGSTKGGAGKSTIAVQLALARCRAGRDVLLVDSDQQATAQTAIALRAEAGRTPAPACVWFPDHRVLGPQMRQQARRYQDVIIDVGGRDSHTLHTAIQLCDVVVVPVRPRSADVWALSDMAAAIDEVRATRDRPLLAYAVLNFADPGTSSANREGAAAVAEFPQFTLIEAPIRQRKALAITLGFGLSVEELTPRDDKACAEIATLTSIVFADAIPLQGISNGNANHQADAEASRPDDAGEGTQRRHARQPRADHRHPAAGDTDPA
jgi:chromosome partitioning protein